jgi:hypothetical protein
MTMNDRMYRANARSRRVPSILLKLLLAWFLSAIVLALAVPALRAQHVHLQGWMVWAVILVATALCVGPDLRGWRRNRS